MFTSIFIGLPRVRAVLALIVCRYDNTVERVGMHTYISIVMCVDSVV